MCRFIKKSFTVALSLTAAMILLIAIQAQAGSPGEVRKPGTLLLVQSVEAQKEQQKSPVPTCGKEEEKLKQEKSGEQKAQMEKQAPKTRSAGTKKFGGQPIRDKESPAGE
jgi:hypothetical protein